MIASAVFAILLIRTVLFFIVGVFLITAGLIAWHEVIYRGRNGLTLAMRDFCLSLGLVCVTNAGLNFYAALEPITNVSFLAMAIISVGFLLYSFWACLRLARKMLEGESG